MLEEQHRGQCGWYEEGAKGGGSEDREISTEVGEIVSCGLIVRTLAFAQSEKTPLKGFDPRSDMTCYVLIE